jgi:hypothetical protein
MNCVAHLQLVITSAHCIQNSYMFHLFRSSYVYKCIHIEISCRLGLNLAKSAQKPRLGNFPQWKLSRAKFPECFRKFSSLSIIIHFNLSPSRYTADPQSGLYLAPPLTASSEFFLFCFFLYFMGVLFIDQFMKCCTYRPAH